MSNEFSLTKIVIVDSLEISEHQTGELLEKYIREKVSEQGLLLRVERRSVSWPSEFADVLVQLALEAEATGESPLLHVEMHGSAGDGLIFSEGGSMPWTRVSQLLTDLNRATRFNLVCFFAACYGAHFAGELWVHRAAPCFGLLAPTDEVDPGELNGGFFRLYRELLETQDMGRASASLARERLSKGQWLNQTAATWFPQVLLRVALDQVSAEGLDAMAARIKARPEALDLPKDIDFRRHAEETAIRYLGNVTFNRFFMVDEIPGNAERFAAVKDRVIREILPLVGRSRKA